MPTRIATLPDAAAVARIYAPAVTVSHTSFELIPPSPDQMARRIAATVSRYPWLIDEVAGAVAGYAYATEHRSRPAYQWYVDVSVYVSPAFQRVGVARRLYEALFAILREPCGSSTPTPASRCRTPPASASTRRPVSSRSASAAVWALQAWPLDRRVLVAPPPPTTAP